MEFIHTIIDKWFIVFFICMFTLALEVVIVITGKGVRGIANPLIIYIRCIGLLIAILLALIFELQIEDAPSIKTRIASWVPIMLLGYGIISVPARIILDLPSPSFSSGKAIFNSLWFFLVGFAFLFSTGATSCNDSGIFDPWSQKIVYLHDYLITHSLASIAVIIFSGIWFNFIVTKVTFTIHPKTFFYLLVKTENRVG